MGEMNVVLVCEDDHDMHVGPLLKALVHVPSVRIVSKVGHGVDLAGRKEFSEARHVSSLEVALQDKSVEAVIVSSVSGKLMDTLKKCIDKKKHVVYMPSYCEEIELMHKRAANKKVYLFCLFPLEHDEAVQQLIHALSDGVEDEHGSSDNDIGGGVRLIRLTGRLGGVPGVAVDEEKSKDVLRGWTAACLHLAGVLVGAGVTASGESATSAASAINVDESDVAVCTSSVCVGPTDCDVGHAMSLHAKFEQGAMVVCETASGSSYGTDFRVEVVGNNGSMLSLANVTSGSVCLHRPVAVRHCIRRLSYEERFVGAYAKGFRAFVRKVRDEESEDGARFSCGMGVKALMMSAKATNKKLSFSVPTLPRTQPPVGVLSGQAVGVCVCGAGRMGQIRARALNSLPNVKVVCFIDAAADKMQHVSAEFGCAVLGDDQLAGALANAAVQVVVVCTTSAAHHKIIMAALNAKKHVFCEKPVALSLKHTLECCKLACTSGLALYTGFQRRSDLHFMRTKELLGAHTVQQIRVTSREPNGHNDKAYLLSSGGFLYDSVIHDIDLARFYAEEEPVEVYCAGHAFDGELGRAGDIDCVALLLRFKSGVIASIDNHRHANYGYDQRVEMFTDEGAVMPGNESVSLAQQWTESGAFSEPPRPGMVRYREAYTDGVQHFLNVLMGLDEEGEFRVTPEDAVFGAAIADAAKLSLKKGKVVTLERAPV
eukprot:TRINITY_DN7721_c0_g1_i1.p1 TRINITY_DN7721_c0_g1~~TRINITY_DN7721_c0_g1_i1.p1  ORF type:complete len:740 (-),score=226.70 TRINITY_DN7721_c0_g1_i1:256-2391(-)